MCTYLEIEGKRMLAAFTGDIPMELHVGADSSSNYAVIRMETRPLRVLPSSILKPKPDIIPEHRRSPQGYIAREDLALSDDDYDGSGPRKYSWRGRNDRYKNKRAPRLSTMAVLQFSPL